MVRSVITARARRLSTLVIGFLKMPLAFLVDPPVFLAVPSRLSLFFLVELPFIVALGVSLLVLVT